jgi:hypothetical protein
MYLLLLLPLLSILWMIMQASTPISPQIQAIVAFSEGSDQPLFYPVALMPGEIQHRVWHLSQIAHAQCLRAKIHRP